MTTMMWRVKDKNGFYIVAGMTHTRYWHSKEKAEKCAKRIGGTLVEPTSNKRGTKNE